MTNKGENIIWDYLDMKKNITIDELKNEKIIITAYDKNNLRSDEVIGIGEVKIIKAGIELNKETESVEENQSSTNQSNLLRQNLEIICQQIHINSNKIREILYLTENDNSNKKFYQNVLPSNSLINSSWIRKVSLFCQIFGNWSPILLSHIQNTFAKDSPKKKKGKKSSKSSLNDSEEGRIISNLIQD